MRKPKTEYDNFEAKLIGESDNPIWDMQNYRGESIGSVGKFNSTRFTFRPNAIIFYSERTLSDLAHFLRQINGRVYE